MPNGTDKPPEQPTPRTCTTCGGQRGYTETTPKPGGGHTSVFRTCTSCGGTGVQGGGI
ncbi:hypothetical protein [Streptomyces sp. NPDC093591]|uniref:hypothetical protein n=1 Tax=Streptomyces sp. NPDC093591 TaxID=3366044 RepID=UPI00380AF1A0